MPIQRINIPIPISLSTYFDKYVQPDISQQPSVLKANLLQNIYPNSGRLEPRAGINYLARVNTWTSPVLAATYSSIFRHYFNALSTSPIEFVSIHSGLYKKTNPFTGYTQLTAANAADTNVMSNCLVFASYLDRMVCLNLVVRRLVGTAAMTFHYLSPIKPTSAATFNAFVGAGNITGLVRYKFTGVRVSSGGSSGDIVEGASGTVSADINPAAQNVTLDVPVIADAQVERRNIYRLAPNNGQNFYLYVGQIADNTSTVANFTDNTAIGSETGVLLDDNKQSWKDQEALDQATYGVPIFLAVCKNRLWILCTKSLWFSTTNSWYFPLLTEPSSTLGGYIDLSSFIGGAKAMAIYSIGSSLVLFTETSMFLITGDSGDNFEIRKIADYGLLSHRAVASGDGYIFFFSSTKKMILFNGQSFIDMGQEIQPTLDSAVQTTFTTFPFGARCLVRIINNKLYLFYPKSDLPYQNYYWVRFRPLTEVAINLSTQFYIDGEHTTNVKSGSTRSFDFSDIVQYGTFGADSGEIWGINIYGDVFQFETGKKDTFTSDSTIDIYLRTEYFKVREINNKTRVRRGFVRGVISTATGQFVMNIFAFNGAVSLSGGAGANIASAGKSIYFNSIDSNIIDTNRIQLELNAAIDGTYSTGNNHIDELELWLSESRRVRP